MARTFNLHQGLLRLWIVATVLWIVVGSFSVDAPSKIHYAWLYATNRASINEKQLASDEFLTYSRPPTTMELSCEKTESEIRSNTKSTSSNPYDALILEMAAKEKCRRVERHEPSAPDWSWLAPVLLPPTLGVVVAMFIAWGALALARWVWRGFKP
jgi:hypothetical protein